MITPLYEQMRHYRRPPRQHRTELVPAFTPAQPAILTSQPDLAGVKVQHVPGDLAPDRRSLRVSHEDRDQVAEQLRVAAGDGRLTVEELDERLEAALTARTYGELDVLLIDLPAVPGTVAVPAPEAKELVRLNTRHGNIRRDGHWAVPGRMAARRRRDDRPGHDVRLHRSAGPRRRHRLTKAA
jgi:hypothetical protein